MIAFLRHRYNDFYHIFRVILENFVQKQIYLMSIIHFF